MNQKLTTFHKFKVLYAYISVFIFNWKYLKYFEFILIE